jgi:hypothetical protein
MQKKKLFLYHEINALKMNGLYIKYFFYYMYTTMAPHIDRSMHYETTQDVQQTTGRQDILEALRVFNGQRFELIP